MFFLALRLREMLIFLTQRHRADGFRLNSLKQVCQCYAFSVKNWSKISAYFDLDYFEQERSDGRKEPAREILEELILIDPVVGGNRSADQVSINGENNGKSIGDPTKLSGQILIINGSFSKKIETCYFDLLIDLR